MSEFLLEVGVENLPAGYVDGAVESLRQALVEALEQERIDHGDVEHAGTPRRLVVRVFDVAKRQRAAEEVVTGPPVARAFDAQGRPTPAAEGFARSRGVDVSRLERVETPRGEYVAVRRRLPRRATASILRERLPGVVASVRTPRAMKWEASGARFARPVRWIVALLDDRVVPVTFAGVRAGRRTTGRPWMPREHATLRRAADWPRAMRRLGIVPDAAERRRRIAAAAARVAAREGLRVVDDADLVAEIAQMTENPRVLTGAFDARYLELPREVVTTAMRAHQRYLALVTSRGRLAPRFVTFTDGPVGSPAQVRRGNERVLRARLEDAAFYWREDLARGVDALATELDRIVFIEGLGSLGEKARRLERLAVAVNGWLEALPRADEVRVARAARLAKADLASVMIRDGKEFTRLQGVIGAHYARAGGESADVVAAIRDHYRPVGPDDALPRSALAIVVGVADRIDTICGCFIAGLRPSGSQDPYALRRSANGLVRLLARDAGVALDRLVRAAVEAYGERAQAADGRLVADLDAFLAGRVEAWLRERRIPRDVADAVCAVAWARPPVALERARAIVRRRRDPVFARLVTGLRRAGNILDDAARRRATSVEGNSPVRAALEGASPGPLSPLDPAALVEREEIALRGAVLEALDAVGEAGDPEAALERLSALADPIDAFFDAVLVNAPDPDRRRARHALLEAVVATFARVADFSRLVEADSGPAGS